MKPAKSKFILINHSILDFELYKEDFHALAAAFKSELFEVATKYGFQLVKIGKYSDLRKRVVFYNKHTDMEAVVAIRKKWPPEFV